MKGYAATVPSLRQRLTWLLRNRDLWDSGAAQSIARKRIVRAMKRDGLVARTKCWKDVRLDDVIAQALRGEL